jgi:hypothetical protein
MTKILYTPLNIPKIVPNDWDAWWQIWNEYAKPVIKAVNNHNDSEGLWKGLDLFESFSCKMFESFGYNMETIYEAPKAPKAPVIDDLINQIRKNLPLIPLKVRVIENLDIVLPHSDHDYEKDELRSLLWNDYDEPVWELSLNGIKKKINLPETTNTWYYKDCPMAHGSIYKQGKSKGIMVIYGVQKDNFYNFLNLSAKKFIDEAWIVE